MNCKLLFLIWGIWCDETFEWLITTLGRGNEAIRCFNLGEMLFDYWGPGIPDSHVHMLSTQIMPIPGGQSASWQHSLHILDPSSLRQHLIGSWQVSVQVSPTIWALAATANKTKVTKSSSKRNMSTFQTAMNVDQTVPFLFKNPHIWKKKHHLLGSFWKINILTE